MQQRRWIPRKSTLRCQPSSSVVIPPSSSIAIPRSESDEEPAVSSCSDHCISPALPEIPYNSVILSGGVVRAANGAGVEGPRDC